MNTKFPINGRYTTLGDLIHEYAKYSSYPDASKNTTYTGVSDDVSACFKDMYLWNYKEQSMPFVQLIYNGNPADEQKALYPYSVVWFDNVYGEHIDPKTRRMQIIQTQDSSALNFDTPITADSIKNKDDIKNGKFMFRFIIPNNDKQNPDHFYYNYRTVNNEAVVMYALRNLLEITKDTKYYFGETDVNVDKLTYRIFDPSACLPLFNIKNRNEQECLFDFDNNNNIISLKPSAYQYLGDYFWTLMYVQHNNYTSIVKYHEDVNQNGNLIDVSKAYNSSKDGITHYDLHNFICSHKNKNSQEMLMDLACAMASANNSTSDKEKLNYKYLHNSTNNQAKALYFLTLFVNSQRFFVSHITSFEYVNISNKSYALREPLLRCDLGLFQTIEYIRISKAVQTTDTILPPWALNANTKIDISIIYKVKYKGIPQPKDGNSILSFTLKDFWDIKDNDNTSDNEGKIKRWVRLVHPGTYDEKTMGVLDSSKVSSLDGSTYKFGTDHFLQPIDKAVDCYSDCSLGTLKWPFNDLNLQVTDERTLKSLAGNTSKEDNYASTANKGTFGGKELSDFTKNNYAPFGYLRIFDYLDNKQVDSSFVINVPILRCKNWWYESAESNSIDTANIASYFDKLYLDAQIAEPEPNIGIYTNTYSYGEDPSGVEHILDRLNTLPIAAPSLIGTANIRQYFGTKIGAAKKWFYASGASEIDPNSQTTPLYTSKYHIYFETMKSNIGNWSVQNDFIESRTQTSNTVDQYEMVTDYRTSVTGIYTLCRVYIDVDEQGKAKNNTKCFYFKVTNAEHKNGNKINVSFLTYTDTNSKQSSGEHTLGFSDHGQITASFILYNCNTPDTLVNIGTSAPSNTLTINAQLLINQTTRDITIIDDEYNNFVLSSLTVPNAFLQIKYHDTPAASKILHLFHYGIKDKGNDVIPVVCFKNPERMFYYPYPDIIDDNFDPDNDPSIVQFKQSEQIKLESKFINADNKLTTDRTLYFSLNNIFAFLDLSDSTTIAQTENVANCPETKFSLGGITFFNTNKQKKSVEFSAAAPGMVLSFVSNSVFLTTNNILVQGESTLSDYLMKLKKLNILISIVIQVYSFKDSNEIKFDTPLKEITVTTSTENDYQLQYLVPDSLTILKFRIELYKEDTSTDTFTVNLANSGWRGNDSTNVVIFALRIPAIGSTEAKEIGDFSNMDNITDKQRLEIDNYKNKFPNGTEVYVGVPLTSYELGEGDNKTWCKHTGWAIDTIPVNTGAQRTIHFSNISQSGKYMSQRTVYALFAEFTSNTGGSTTPTVPEYGITINIDDRTRVEIDNTSGTNTNSTFSAGTAINIKIKVSTGSKIKTLTIKPNIVYSFANDHLIFNMPNQNVSITITSESDNSTEPGS